MNATAMLEARSIGLGSREFAWEVI